MPDELNTTLDARLSIWFWLSFILCLVLVLATELTLSWVVFIPMVASILNLMAAGAMRQEKMRG
jgi:hypothetical protein